MTNYLILASSRKGDFAKEVYYFVQQETLSNALADAAESYVAEYDVEAFQMELVTTEAHLLGKLMPNSLTAQIEESLKQEK